MLLYLFKNYVYDLYVKFLSWLYKDSFIYFAIYSKETNDYQILVDYFSIKGILYTWYYKFFQRTGIMYDKNSIGISIYTNGIYDMKYILASYCVIHSSKKVIYAILDEEIDLTKEINLFGCEAVQCKDLVGVLLKYKGINYDLENIKLKVVYEKNILEEVILEAEDLF